MKHFWKNLWTKLKIYLTPFVNWRFLLVYAISWGIVNGIWYVGLFLGIHFQIPVLTSICGAYLAFLWNPFCLEKLVSVPFAIWLHHIFFKNDLKTRAQLLVMHEEAKSDWQKIKNKFKRKNKKQKEQDTNDKR